MKKPLQMEIDKLHKIGRSAFTMENRIRIFKRTKFEILKNFFWHLDIYLDNTTPLHQRLSTLEKDLWKRFEEKHDEEGLEYLEKIGFVHEQMKNDISVTMSILYSLMEETTKI